MCLLVLKDKEATIKEKYLKNAYDSNPDGVGYSFPHGDKLITKKFRKYDKFLKNWNYDIKTFGSITPFLLHFRLATHGQNKGTLNVHPFNIRQGLVFAHNGIINEVDDDKKLSDTQVFNRDILKNLKKSFLNDLILIKLIEGFIGSSKLAFLDSNGAYKILNESLGHWEKGVWYSNSTYKHEPIRYSSNLYGGSYYGWDDDFGRERKRATEIVKYLPTKEQCGWCGHMVDTLTQTDISDMYEDEEPSYLWMCEECVEIEDEHRETDSYNNSFKLSTYEEGGNL